MQYSRTFTNSSLKSLHQVKHNDAYVRQILTDDNSIMYGVLRTLLVGRSDDYRIYKDVVNPLVKSVI